MSEVNKRFGRRVRELRLARGLSQEKLAFEAGVHRAYLSGIERGERHPTVKTSRCWPGGSGSACPNSSPLARLGLRARRPGPRLRDLRGAFPQFRPGRRPAGGGFAGAMAGGAGLRLLSEGAARGSIGSEGGQGKWTLA